MFATSKTHTLNIEVPPPMAVFTRWKIHPDNEQIIERQQDARLLHRTQLRKYKRAYRAVEYALHRAGQLEFVDDLDALRKAYRSAKLRHREAHEVNQPETAAVLAASAQAYRQALRALDQPVRWRRGLFDWLRPRRRYARRLAASKTLRDLLRLYVGLGSRLAEHGAAVEHQHARTSLEPGMKREAELFRDILVERWAALGFCHKYHIYNGTRSVQRTDYVKMERAIVTDDLIHYRILGTSRGIFGNTINHMPEGVSIGKLLEPDVLANLTHACQREVTTPHHELNVNFVNGGWITVSRLAEADGLREHIPLEPVWAEFPTPKRDKLPIPMGIRRGLAVNYVMLSTHPHLMICGQTGSGKSNVFDVLIGTVVKYQPPSAVQLILIDLKEGVGFDRWKTLPHLANPIVSDTGELRRVLTLLEDLRRRRTLAIKGYADNIDDYNAGVSEEKRMPRLICIIDEFQQVAADKENKAEIHSLTHQLTAKGRNVGIHLIFGTQTPYADNMPSPIRANVTFVATGRQRMVGAAIATMGGKEATELPKIPGRMWIQDGMHEYAVQMPFMSGANRREALTAAAGWELYEFHLAEAASGDGTKLVFDHAAMMNLVTGELDGKLNGAAVYPHAKAYGLSERKVAALVTEAVESIRAAGGTVEWNGQTWELRADRKAHKLVPAGVS